MMNSMPVHAADELPRGLARRLAPMMDNELFATMELLARASEGPQQEDREEIMSRIAPTESENRAAIILVSC